ncbi:MAG: hypothetical protein WCG47_02420 [Dermatophilaceae bacterium]|jgi:hypothetical protein
MHPPFTSEGLPDAGMAYDLWVAARDASVAAGGVFAPEDEVLPDRPWNGIDGL